MPPDMKMQPGILTRSYVLSIELLLSTGIHFLDWQ